MVVYKDNLKSIADLTRNALENWYQITEKYLKKRNFIEMKSKLYIHVQEYIQVFSIFSIIYLRYQIKDKMYLKISNNCACH